MLALGWRASTPLDDATRAEYEAAYSRPTSVAAMLGYYREATRPRIAAALRRATPNGRPRVQAERALVLWGARDPILPVSTGEGVVSDLGPRCEMVTVPGAGHFVVEEAADVVSRVLADFLADVPAARLAPVSSTKATGAQQAAARTPRPAREAPPFPGG
jgi:pimeloyl-ACP methyl ester carboxylesterase